MIPIITNILNYRAAVGTTAEGPTTGGTYVEIYGDGFRLPPLPIDGPQGPTSSGIVIAGVPETVSVTFNGEPGIVSVLSTGRLQVLSPKTPLPLTKAAGYGVGLVDIEIKNLDDNGDPIAGEVVSRTDAFSYRRPKLDAAHESTLLRIVRQLINEWKSQVLPETILTVNTDYDSDTADGLNTIDLAQLPAIILVGPGMVQNREYSDNEATTESNLFGDVQIRKPAQVVDLLFNVVGLSNSTMELVNLASAATVFMDRNPYIFLDCDPNDPSQGRVKYEFDYQSGGAFDVGGTPGYSNIRQFKGSIRIRGFRFEGFSSFEFDELNAITTTVREDGITVNTSSSGD